MIWYLAAYAMFWAVLFGYLTGVSSRQQKLACAGAGRGATTGSSSRLLPRLDAWSALGGGGAYLGGRVGLRRRTPAPK